MKVTQSCSTYCVFNYTVHRTRQARLLEWVAFPLEKAVVPHSSILAWKIPWREEPRRLQSMGSLRAGHDWATSLSHIGEGNGNPLQCSCLENPRDCRTWWAAVYGVTQSWTWLKQLSSSSSSSLSLLQGIFPIQGLNPGVESTSQLTANKGITISDLPQGTGLFFQL